MPSVFSARLRAHVQAITGSVCSPADLLVVCQRARQVLETENLRGRYPHLALYCDWIVHPALDRNPGGFEVLESINSRMIKAFIKHDENTVADISETLSINFLRQEIMMLLMETGAPTNLSKDAANWQKFITVILEDLCDKPIMFLKKRKGAIAQRFDRMTKEWRGAGFPDIGPCQGVYIDAQRNPDSDKGFYWNVEVLGKDLRGRDFIKIRGLIVEPQPIRDIA